MNKRIIFILVCAVVLTGCSNLEKKQITSVEELETKGTMAVRESNTQKETEASETLNGVDKEKVEWYIGDSHFYDEKDGVDFLFSEIGQNEKYHITILDAWCTNDLAECGEYFVEDSKRIMEMRNSAKEAFRVKDEDIIYLCAKIQLTNREDKETQVDMGYFLPHIRIPDDRLVEYGLADAYVDFPLVHTELRYDYEKKKAGKSYYFFNMQPGETTEPITIVYLIEKEKALGDLYLVLNLGSPKYNSKFRCNFPPDDEDTKFLKINLREVSE